MVLSFGGSLSGEHGDGQSRAALLPKMFGPELVEAFREFKALWDPDNRMNPGKLIDAVRVYDPVENLRHATEMSPHPLQDGLPRSARIGDRGNALRLCQRQRLAERATERCVGVGACRNTVGGVMCPSYRATGEEQHSTRGRAHLLWEMLAGALRKEGFQSDAVHEALDLCLSCKACKSECPVQVDMAAYKSEFLAQRYKGRLHPLHHYIFGFADKLARYGSIAPALTNALLTGPLTSPLIKRIAGVAQRTPTAATGAQKLSRASASRGSAQIHVQGAAPAAGGSVARHLEQLLPPANPGRRRDRARRGGLQGPNAARATSAAAARFTTSACSARRAPISSKVLDRMAPQIDAGLPFIFLEPSCASVFKDEMLELFPNDARAKRLSNRSGCWPTCSPPQRPILPPGSLTGCADSCPRPLPPQGSFRRTGERDRAAAQDRRQRRAYPGRLLRHGRTLRL